MTVVHIGNPSRLHPCRFITKSFKDAGYEIKQVMTITDVGHLVGDGDEGEDKMTKSPAT